MNPRLDPRRHARAGERGCFRCASKLHRKSTALREQASPERPSREERVRWSSGPPTVGNMLLYVHAVGSTDKHTRERRAFRYAKRCAQCGKRLEKSTHVAAHVVRYDLPNCCCGDLTLRTCCRSCNSKHQAAARAGPLSNLCCRHAPCSSCFVKCCDADDAISIAPVRHPACCYYHVPAPAPSRSRASRRSSARAGATRLTGKPPTSEPPRAPSSATMVRP